MSIFNRKKIQFSLFLDDELSEKDRCKVQKQLYRSSKKLEYLESMRAVNQDLTHYYNLRDSFIPDPPPFATILEIPDEDKVPEEQIKTSFLQNISNRFMSTKEAFSSDEFVELTFQLDGAATHALSMKLLPAILTILGILLFYAPKLNANLLI